MFLFCSQRDLFVVVTFLGVVLFLFVLIYKYTTSDQSSLLLWGHWAGQKEGIQGFERAVISKFSWPHPWLHVNFEEHRAAVLRAYSGLGEAETEITRLQEAFLGRPDSVRREGSTMSWCTQGRHKPPCSKLLPLFPGLTSLRTSVSVWPRYLPAAAFCCRIWGCRHRLRASESPLSRQIGHKNSGELLGCQAASVPSGASNASPGAAGTA